MHGPRAVRARRHDDVGRLQERRPGQQPTSRGPRRRPVVRLHGPVRVRAAPAAAHGARRRDVRDRHTGQGAAGARRTVVVVGRRRRRPFVGPGRRVPVRPNGQHAGGAHAVRPAARGVGLGAAAVRRQPGGRRPGRDRLRHDGPAQAQGRAGVHGRAADHAREVAAQPSDGHAHHDHTDHGHVHRPRARRGGPGHGVRERALVQLRGRRRRVPGQPGTAGVRVVRPFRTVHVGRKRRRRDVVAVRRIRHRLGRDRRRRRRFNRTRRQTRGRQPAAGRIVVVVRRRGAPRRRRPRARHGTGAGQAVRHCRFRDRIGVAAQPGTAAPEDPISRQQTAPAPAVVRRRRGRRGRQPTTTTVSGPAAHGNGRSVRPGRPVAVGQAHGTHAPACPQGRAHGQHGIHRVLRLTARTPTLILFFIHIYT